MRLKTMINRYSFFGKILSSTYFLLTISVLAVIFYVLLFAVVYEQNDDVMMKLISNGYATGNPESHLVFINTFIGSILKQLYSLIPAIEWYSIMMISLLLSSFSSNLFCILRYEEGNKKIALTFFNLIVLYFLSRLQFSYVSGFLAVSSLILLYYGLKKDSKKTFFLAIPFMLLSSMIRVEMFVFTFFPLYIIFVFSIRNLKKQLGAAIGIVLVVLAWFFNYQSYQNKPEWKSYFEYNKARGSITASSNIDHSFANAKRIGLSSEDIKLFNHYIYSDNFTTEKMIAMAKSPKKRSGNGDILNFLFSYTKPYFISLVALLIIALFFKNWKVSIGIALHFLICFLTIKYVNNVQYRILYPSLFLFIFFTLKELKGNLKIKFATSYFALFILLVLALRDIRQTSFFALRSKEYIEKIESKLPNNKIFVVDPTSNPKLISRLAFRQPLRQYIFHGWLTNYPYYKEKIPNYSANPYQMSRFPLVIKKENYDLLKDEIKNSEVFVIENRDEVLRIINP